MLADTVAPRVTLDRVAALLTQRLPGAGSCAITLGHADPPEQPALAAPIADAAGHYGWLTLDLAPGTPPAAADQQLLDWVAAAVVPIARIALQVDVPHTPRP